MSIFKITPLANNQWAIEAQRSLKTANRSAQGKVVITQATPPEAEAPPHGGLAGARAWLALAQRSLMDQYAETAIAEARAGLEELGDDYHDPSLRVTEDTTLRIRRAKELIKQGQTTQAADMLVEALAVRVKLYAKLHAESVVS